MIVAGTPMKRKLSLFLFAVMVAVSLGATIVASLAIPAGFEKQAAEIATSKRGSPNASAVFQTMLRSQHAEITAHMGKVLPQIVAELESLGRKPGDLRSPSLDALTKTGVQHIYFIDRAHKVFQTNLASDMNLGLSRQRLHAVPDSVYGDGLVTNDGIDLSSLTARSGPTATSAPGRGLHCRNID
jgi:hypothetical protein